MQRAYVCIQLQPVPAGVGWLLSALQASEQAADAGRPKSTQTYVFLLPSCTVLLHVLPLCHLQISCAWGFTTSGGAKGVGESTTSAVVISLVMIFVADFVLSFLFFQGQGDALKQLK